MRKLIFIFLLFLSPIFAQITVIFDNEDAGFSVIGDWKSNSNVTYYNGTAYHKNKGDGSAYALWENKLTFPGTYKLETYVFNYKFGKDTEWKITTAKGDTNVFVDMYYNPGWVEVGEFNFADSFSVKLSDFFASDTGVKVFADAIRFTSTMALFSINSNIILNGDNQNCDVELVLTKSGENEILATVKSDYKNRIVSFEQFPDGDYTITATAIGYQKKTIENVTIAGGNADVEVMLEPLSENLFTVSGSIELLDEKTNVFCRTLLYLSDTVVAVDSTTHGGSFELEGIPAGSYTLIYDINNYTNITANFVITDQNIELETQVFYPQFNFAWITDSHIGLSFTNPQFQQVISNINNCDVPIDFIMHTGDLTEHGYNSELDLAYDYLSDANYPYYISIGNHDTKWSESGLNRYQSLFGDLYFSFDHKGFHFINLNDAITLRGSGGYFNPVQYEWLRNDLESMEDPNMPVIVMYHIPTDASAVPNNWQIHNILKDYRIMMIFTGHGHSNHIYNFEGLPGVMSMDTYNADRESGFNVVSASEKEIVLTPYRNTTGKGDPWYTFQCPDSAGTRMTFANIESGETLTESKSLQIKLSKPATGGSFIIQPDYKAGSVTGSGNEWELNIDPSELANGYHYVKVTMMIDGGNAVYKSFEFFTENGEYPKALWRFNAKDEILSKPEYDGENVYFGTGKGTVYALNAESGNIAWEIMTDGSVYSSPAVDNDLVFAGTNKGTLYALNTSDGTVKWSYAAGNSMQSGILVVDSLIYLGAGTNLLAVNKETGELVWKYETNGAIESKPAVSGNKIICTSWDTNVYCLDRFSGSKVWSWNYQGSMYYAPGAGWPVIINNLVFVVDPAKNMSCLSLDDGSLQWQSAEPNVWDSIGKNEKNNQVYVRGLDGNLYAFEPTNERTVIWSVAAQFGFDAKPSMPFGKMGAVFAGGSSGNLVSASQLDGKMKWIYHTGSALVNSVTPKDGVSAFITSLDGTVAYITGDPALDIETGIVPEFENILLPSYPNPFNNTTTIQYTLKSAQKISIHVYDILGNEIMKKSEVHNAPGLYKFTWNAVDENNKNLSSGMYLLRLEGESFTDQKKMLFLK